MLGSYSLSLWIDFSWRSVYYSAQESPADYRRQVRECRKHFLALILAVSRWKGQAYVVLLGSVPKGVFWLRFAIQTYYGFIESYWSITPYLCSWRRGNECQLARSSARLAP